MPLWEVLSGCGGGTGQEGPRKVSDSRTCKPNSVCRREPAGRSFLWAGHYCPALATYPEVMARRVSTQTRVGASPSLFGLAPCGVCPARPIAGTAVRSYRTFSPLPGTAIAGVPGRYVFCGTFRQRPFERRRPDVIRHTALRSSDFPLPHPRSLDESSVHRAEATVRSGCQPLNYKRCCRDARRILVRTPRPRPAVRLDL